jgi:uncharacterized protein DUF5636
MEQTMSWYTEIENEDHAGRCIKQWFGPITYLQEYAALATLLANKPPYVGKFEEGLRNLSEALWKIYLEKITDGSNRLTRSIQKLASNYGFAMHTQEKHVVYIGQLSEDVFLANVKNKILWKDSFGFGHGEFSHSYQWLVAGELFGWLDKTSTLYSGASALSAEDIFYLNGSQPAKGKRALWQWLVDSVPDNKQIQKYKDLGGFTDDHLKHNGHCLTEKTFRNANFVQTELLKHKDWFLGYYAERRSNKLNGIAQTTLLKEKKDPNPKWSAILLQAQQRGLADLYKSKQPYKTSKEENKKEKIDNETEESQEGVFVGKLRMEGALKKGKKVIFHNVPGTVPE